jgi:hypothetical protein
VSDDEAVSVAVRTDAHGTGSALLAGELVRPGCVCCVLRGGEDPLKVPVALPAPQVAAGPVDQAARSQGEGEALAPVIEQGLDPPPNVETKPRRRAADRRRGVARAARYVERSRRGSNSIVGVTRE